MTARTVDGIRVVVATATDALSVEHLTAGERARFEEMRTPHRREQWLVSRRALREALSATGRPTDTAQYSFPHARASLSHSRVSAVAVAVEGEPASVLGVGIDIEPVRVVREGTVRFFLSPSEIQWLASVPENSKLTEHIRLWTVKEALFKSDPGNADTRLMLYELDDPAPMAGAARRSGERGITFRYATTVRPDGVETIAVALTA